MASVLTNTGKKKFLAAWLASDDFTAHLYQNEVTPFPAMAASDLVECDFVDYAPADLVGGVVLPDLDAGNRAVVVWSGLAWIFGGPGTQTVFGWFLLDSAGDLIIAERFIVPVLLADLGQPINLAPRVTQRSQFLNS